MTNEQILNKIKAIVEDQTDADVESIVESTNFKDDLDLDSLDVFEIVNEIEDEFDIEIETEDESLDTVGEVVNYVSKKIRRIIEVRL
ncbi:acyl carrier protein [Holzapfeliella floricola]|uniref:acyl carrier protein n=1 Tax=Holzapfeliella floricola TaxID=679249 RepID=UPI000782304F|nr:acyl carrier protein [Holzapfeliella floricola]